MIALMLTIELLSFAPESQRATAVLQALRAAAPGPAVATTQYVGAADLLVLWGPGDPARFSPMRTQLASGGHVLALDLAYWDRFRKFRVSIDAAHPQAWVLRHDWPATRLAADGITVANRWNPDGAVIVAGIGRKARIQYGTAVEQWEEAQIAAARGRGKRVLYRRKQVDAPVPSGVELAPDRPIDDALSGASLVITWHSNVAVDAIRLGVPVICQDGAAAAVCPSTFGPDDPQPLTPTLRDRFLSNLAWFQWGQSEAAEFWRWVPKVLS